MNPTPADPGYEVAFRAGRGRPWEVLATAPTREAATAAMFDLMATRHSGGWHVRRATAGPTTPDRSPAVSQITFIIPANTKAKCRRAGDADWQPFVTTRESKFTTYEVADGGGCWVFQEGDHQLKVATRFVVGRQPKPAQSHLPAGGVCTLKGKGASRRSRHHHR